MGQIRLETVSADGNTPVNSVVQGDTFILNVYAVDLRSEPAGVFAAYVDLFFKSSLVSLNGDVAFGADFSNGRTYDTNTTDLIDELGAFTSATTGPSESLLASIPFRADAIGAIQFTADPADDLPANDFLLFGENGAINQDQIIWDIALLEIVAENEIV